MTFMIIGLLSSLGAWLIFKHADTYQLTRSETAQAQVWLIILLLFATNIPEVTIFALGICLALDNLDLPQETKAD